MRFRVLVGLLSVGLVGGLVGCDDDQAVSGCQVDADCRGERVCVESVCMDPGGDMEPDPSTTPEADPNNMPDDPPIDPPDAGPGDTGMMDPELPGEDEPSAPPRTVCDEALEQIEMCGIRSQRSPEENRVGWPECGDFDACAAECALEMTCGDLMCDWDNDVDCDFAPWSDCVQRECGEQPEPEGEDETICEAALERFEGECGYGIADQERIRPEDFRVLRDMEAGVCGEFEACYAGCMVHEVDDQCMSCHFGMLDCLRDPFGECVDRCRRAPDVTLCIQSGGLWGDGECEDCCGPAGCGQDPFEPCPEPCCGPPQCYCPNDRPFWEADRGCFNDDACFP